MEYNLTPGELGYALGFLALVAKGALDIFVRHKRNNAPERGCMYGDEAHDILKAKLDKLEHKCDKVLYIVERLDK